MTRKPVLCLDFDGVLHDYTSRWTATDEINDGPVPGAMAFLGEAVQHFSVAVYSARSATLEGRVAMRLWLERKLIQEFGHNDGWAISDALKFPDRKPSALVALDDRTLTFTGVWPDVRDLLDFKPWNKKEVE